MLGAYSTGLAEWEYTDDDSIIFCHDDIHILLREEVFNAIVDSHLDMPNTGFIGIAGCRSLGKFAKDANWYANINPRHFDGSEGGGQVWQGTEYSSLRIGAFASPAYMWYGINDKAVLMDGVFLAAKGSTVRAISFISPSLLKSKWHNYDALMTFQAHMKGKVNRIAPICIMHESTGGYASEHYQEDVQMFMQLFSKWLPTEVVVN